MHESDRHEVTEFVTATVERQLFGLPITRVQDVFAPTRLTRVPLARPEVAGVLNLRGRIVTVVDLRSRLGMPAQTESGNAMAIGIEHAGEAYGLLVDSVGQVLRISDAVKVANPVNLDPRLAAVSAGIYRLEDELLIILDVDRVLRFEGADRAA